MMQMSWTSLKLLHLLNSLDQNISIQTFIKATWMAEHVQVMFCHVYGLFDSSLFWLKQNNETFTISVPKAGNFSS